MIDRLKKWFRIQPDPKITEPPARITHLETLLRFHINPEHYQLFLRALRHRSIVDNEKFESFETYERLEFLGDAVLDLIITEILFEKFPTENEGFLTKLRAKIVRGDTLFKLAKKLDLNNLLEIGERAAGQGIELSKSVLADVYEALIAAVYVSKGYEKAFEFVQWNLDEFLDFDEIVNNIDNYKSLLMEFSQAEKLNLPRYVVLSEEGPGHDKTFHVAVYIDDKKLGVGQGKSKKQAEQVAARNALDLIMK
jgi:ribonuclease III